MALFEGAKVGLQGLMIERLSGDFGISASRQAEGTITGRIAGRKGGTVQLTPPAGFDIARCHVEIHGAAAPHRVEGRAIRFDVPIVQADGCKSYTVSADR